MTLSDDRRVRAGTLLLVLCSLIPACAASPRQRAAGPRESASTAPLIPAGWVTYSYPELGLSFAYPPVSGKVSSPGHPPDSGVRYAWSIERSDRCDSEGICRGYEFAAVNDGCPASEGWPTYVHIWIERDGKNILTSCEGTSPFEVAAIKFVVRSDGLRGMIYDANVWLDNPIRGAQAAVLNFPADYDNHYEAIAFYFEDPTPLSDIETVLRSVHLDRRTR